MRLSLETRSDLSFRDVHIHRAEVAVLLRVSPDGTDVILAEKVEEITADVQLRQSADKLSVLEQIRHLHRRREVSVRRHVSARRQNHEHRLAGNELRERLSGGVEPEAVERERRNAVISRGSSPEFRQSELIRRLLRRQKPGQLSVLDECWAKPLGDLSLVVEEADSVMCLRVQIGRASCRERV